MKLPVLRRYNTAVFYTYLSVVLFALVTAGYGYNNKKNQLMADKQSVISQHAKQVDMLLASSVRSLQSLHIFTVTQLTQAKISRSSNADITEHFEQQGNYFTGTSSENPDFSQSMGRLSGRGSLSNRDNEFYSELSMLQLMTKILPIAKQSASKASQLYYISAREMMAVYPWPKGDDRFNTSLLNSPLFELAQPDHNPEQKLFWSDIQRNSDGQLITTVGMPVYVGKKFYGSLFIDIELATLAKQIERYFEVDGTVYLLDGRNNLLTYPQMHHEQVGRAYQLSQKLPPVLNAMPLVQLLDSNHGRINDGYYIQSMPMQEAPWRLLFLQPETDLVANAMRQLESTFITVVIALSVLITVVHYLTRRAFFSPASKLLTHLERCAEHSQPPPQQINPGWESWFELISRTFEENQQYTLHLAEQNRRLDKLVAKRTERLRLANEQRERDFSLMRSLIDAIPEAIVFKDTQGRYLGCNKAAERMLGRSESELIGHLVTELDPSERAQRQAEEDQKVLEDRTPNQYREEVEVDGKILLSDALILPFYNRRGELLGLISVWRDITRDANQQEQLRQSEQRYHLAMDAVEDGMWDWYLNSNLAICNPAYYTMLGYEPNEFPLLIETIYEMMHEDDRQRVERYVDGLLNDADKPMNIEYRLRAKDGSYRWMLSRGKVVEFDELGEPIRMVGVNKDITQQKENEVTLLEAKREAELANRTKSEFLANMSHEIRTPMNAVLGMLELTLRTEVDPRQQDYLEKAKLSAASLLRIINDILDFSKIEAGKLELEQLDFSVDKVLDHVLSMSTIKAQEKGVELLLYAPFASGLHIRGDSLRLGQILVNLLSNAVKFTHEGEVELGCEDIEENDGRISLKFWVRDSGIGISEEHQQRLFDAFSQADGSTTRQYGGSGLGLSICKHLVSMMGGEIKVESSLGRGTTFSFTIDALRVDAPEHEQRTLPEQLHGVNAVVVDDNHSALQIYSTYLRDLGFNVETADNGEDALTLIRQQQPQLMLIDWMMPNMDGLGVVDAVHQQHLDDQLEQLPEMLMMTAYSSQSLRKPLEQGKFQAILQKPFKKSELQDAVLDVLAARCETKDCECSTDQPEERAKEETSQKILLVEDNLINQQVATELLKSAGYQVTLVENGQLAVDIVADQSFDLVLMDIQMPVMDGLEATRQIRKSNTQLPIVAMTAHAMTGDRDKSLAAGMNDHITKPIVLPQLFETVKKWITVEQNA